jgi:hypothetical protein
MTGVGLGSSTVKLLELVAVPPGVTTVSGPEVAPTGITKVSVAASTTVKLPTLVPLSSTMLVPARLVPVTDTSVPVSPLLGVKLTRIGAGIIGSVMVNVAAADEPPCADEGLTTTTFINPAVATNLAGTWAVSCVDASYVVLSSVFPKLTTEPFTKPVPFTTSEKVPLPATISAGLRLVIVGVGSNTVKAAMLLAVPLGVVSASRPEVAPAGTTKVSVVASTTVKLPTLAPLSSTAVVLTRLVPVMVTRVPTEPLLGVKLRRVGAGGVTVNVAGTELPPPGAGFVTSIS